MADQKSKKTESNDQQDSATHHKNQGQIDIVVGDSPDKITENPFHIHFEGVFRQWIADENLSLALTTYEGAKLILIGPGVRGGTIVSERNFERCMSMFVEDHRHIWLSTHHHIWKLENGLEDGYHYEGWDRVYLPRLSHVTGGVDVHDLVRAGDGHLYGVITGYNCIARICPEEKGCFTPFWKPPFVTEIVGEDRCHLNGFCLDENDEFAYATVVGVSNEKGGWREHKNDGGVIIDMRTDEIVAEGLSMPHTPRLYQGDLWVLEAGTGHLCRVNPKTKEVERKLWRPGFLRGLRFYKNYALICCSSPRDKTFKGLPLDDELEKRKVQPQCALDVVDLNSMEVVFSMQITGTVKEIYDVALLPGCKQPLLHGVIGDEIRKFVVLGEDESSKGPLKTR